MTSAFRGTDAAIVAFISAVVAAANPERPTLPSMGAHIIGDISTRGLKPHSSSVTDSGRHSMLPRPNLSTPQDGGATI